MTKDFETFADGFSDDLMEQLKAIGCDASSVGVKTVHKLNETYEAITVSRAGANIGVSTNLTTIYNKYCAGEDYGLLVEQTAEHIRDGLEQAPKIDAASLSDYESVKSLLCVEVVSAERNEEMLKAVPHERMEDLAVVCRIQLDAQDGTEGTILMTNAMLEQYGVSAEELYRDALETAAITKPAQIRGMMEVLRDMAGPEEFGDAPPEELMFVASTKGQANGAGVIAYPDFMEQAAKRLGGDFYILPSSIHEVILVPDNGAMNAGELQEMVRSVNASEVQPEDQLSDHAYHYDSREHVFELAEKFEEKRQNREHPGREDADRNPDKGFDLEERAEWGKKTSLLAELKEKKAVIAEGKAEKSPHHAARSREEVI
ncbi:hypothetical protein SAMN02745687_02121 [Lachnospiraceae bacterium NK3A20]|nr:hypothetical protein SAMN02745687_02121 [Lachnospiraceae bacterium NK3A20]